MQQKSISAAKLASITDKQEYIKQLKDILLQLDQSKEVSNKEKASSSGMKLDEYEGPKNEDNCYEIFSQISQGHKTIKKKIKNIFTIASEAL